MGAVMKIYDVWKIAQVGPVGFAGHYGRLVICDKCNIVIANCNELIRISKQWRLCCL